MALDSDGDASAKRPRAGEEGNQGDVSDGDAITKRLRVDEEGNQGADDTVALESDSDDSDTTERLRADGKAIHGDETKGVALVLAGARIPREDDGGSQDDDAADHISGMADDVMLEILTLLPLKSAIRTAVLSKEWSRVWNLHCKEGGGKHPFFLHHHLVASTTRGPSPEKLPGLLEQRGGSRLHRFSLIVETSKMSASCFSSCLKSVARCDVEDLHVELGSISARNKIIFHFPYASTTLARLSLRCLERVGQIHYKSAQDFSKLGVIHLYKVGIVDKALAKMVSICPALHTIDLFYCNSLSDLRGLFRERNLRTLTVAECAGLRDLDAWFFFGPPCSIRSFRYLGSFLWIFHLPSSAAFTDLCICYNDAIPPYLSSEWFDNTLFNRSELTVLTICSNTLQAVSSLTDAGVHHAGLPKVANFHHLKELQLIMFEMKEVNLAGIYAFLKNCPCPILESLFLQLPTKKSPACNVVIEEPPEDVLENLPLLDAHNDVIEEPPEDVLENLKVVKITNFSCDPIAVQLVLFLLRKANSLRELLLVTPNNHVFDIPDIGQADRLLLYGALASGKLVLKPDNTAPYPLHSDVIAEL